MWDDISQCLNGPPNTALQIFTKVLLRHLPTKNILVIPWITTYRYDINKKTYRWDFLSKIVSLTVKVPDTKSMEMLVTITNILSLDCIKLDSELEPCWSSLRNSYHQVTSPSIILIWILLTKLLPTLFPTQCCFLSLSYDFFIDSHW